MTDLAATLQWLDDVHDGKVTEVAGDGKWPIRNALLCLREDMARTKDAADDYHHGVHMALAYAVEVIKGINSMKEPEPPDPAKAAGRAMRQYYAQMADAADTLAAELRVIAGGDIPDGEW